MKKLSSKECSEIVDAIVSKTTEYLKLYPKVESLVIGLSGGADSVLAAALMARVVAPLPKVWLIGKNLPSILSRPKGIARAELTGTLFCDSFEKQHINIKPLLKTLFRKEKKIWREKKSL